MAVKIGSARIDERGKASGGKAGDQTGNELSTQNWYKHSKGWRLLRCTDAAKAEKIASAMEKACANQLIGYDQSERLTLYNKAKSVGFDPSKVTTACETDCSALVRVCLAYAGITTDNFITSDEAKKILATGCFKELTDSKYTDSSDYLMRGDVLVTKKKGHTVVVLSNGAKAEANVSAPTTASATTSDPKPVMTEVMIISTKGNKVNVRYGNGTQYGVIKVVKTGTTYDYVATASNGWKAIVIGNKVGWVSGKYAVII